MTNATNQHNMEALLKEREQELSDCWVNTIAECWRQYVTGDLEEKGLLINKINQVLREVKI